MIIKEQNRKIYKNSAQHVINILNFLSGNEKKEFTRNEIRTELRKLASDKNYDSYVYPHAKLVYPIIDGLIKHTARIKIGRPFKENGKIIYDTYKRTFRFLEENNSVVSFNRQKFKKTFEEFEDFVYRLYYENATYEIFLRMDKKSRWIFECVGRFYDLQGYFRDRASAYASDGYQLIKSNSNYSFVCEKCKQPINEKSRFWILRYNWCKSCFIKENGLPPYKSCAPFVTIRGT